MKKLMFGLTFGAAAVTLIAVSTAPVIPCVVKVTYQVAEFIPYSQGKRFPIGVFQHVTKVKSFSGKYTLDSKQLVCKVEV